MRLAVLTALCFVLCASLTIQANERTDVTRRCIEMFGNPIQPEGNLFEVNDSYVLEVVFNKHDRLQRFLVQPKYFYELRGHPDWAEKTPSRRLSWYEYRSLLGKLDWIKEKGNVSRDFAPRMSSAITNMTLWRWDYYDHAFINYGEVNDFQAPIEELRQVRWFRINFQKPSVKNGGLPRKQKAREEKLIFQ